MNKLKYWKNTPPPTHTLKVFHQFCYVGVLKKKQVETGTLWIKYNLISKYDKKPTKALFFKSLNSLIHLKISFYSCYRKKINHANPLDYENCFIVINKKQDEKSNDKKN